jgi:hypothetical protein
MKRWLLLAFFCSTALAQQYEVPQFPVGGVVAGEKSDRKLGIAMIPRSAIRSPRSAARNLEARSARRGPRFNVSGRIVPGHDPAVMTRYPHVAPRVVRID